MSGFAGGRTDERRVGRDAEEPALVSLDRHGQVEDLAVRLHGHDDGRARPDSALGDDRGPVDVLSAPTCRRHPGVDVDLTREKVRQTLLSLLGPIGIPREVGARERLGERSRSKIRCGGLASRCWDLRRGSDRGSQTCKGKQRDAASEEQAWRSSAPAHRAQRARLDDRQARHVSSPVLRSDLPAAAIGPKGHSTRSPRAATEGRAGSGPSCRSRASRARAPGGSV